MATHVLRALSHPGGRSLRQFGQELLHSLLDDDVFGRSAQLAYYFFFALFPGFLFISSLPGLLSGTGSGLRANLMQHLATVVPPQAFVILQQTFDKAGQNAGKITFGAIAALWSATAGMSAVCDTLNAVHDVKEGRPYWKVQLTAFVLTLITAVMLLCAFMELFVGDAMIHAAGHTIFHGAVWVVIKVAQWGLALLLVMLIFGLTYFWAPDIRDREWHWITPGAALGITLWALASVALRVYLHYSDSYSVTYGTVGAVMILLLWFYIAGFALLTGAEINAVIEDAAAQQGDASAITRGEKAPQAA